MCIYTQTFVNIFTHTHTHICINIYRSYVIYKSCGDHDRNGRGKKEQRKQIAGKFILFSSTLFYIALPYVRSLIYIRERVYNVHIYYIYM